MGMLTEQRSLLLGGFGTVTGVSIDAPDAISVKASMTGGKQVTVVFKQETQAPYRVTSISFQLPGHGG